MANIYVKLQNGRDSIDAEPEDSFGFVGPILGPFVSVHIAYGQTIRLVPERGPETVLDILNDFVGYEGKFYGDIAIEAGQ